MFTYLKNALICAVIVAAPVVSAANPPSPPVEKNQILEIQLALIESCENTPGCMALNGYHLFNDEPVTYEVATTWEEYQKAFHSMQEVTDAIEAERNQRDQDGKP